MCREPGWRKDPTASFFSLSLSPLFSYPPFLSISTPLFFTSISLNTNSFSLDFPSSMACSSLWVNTSKQKVKEGFHYHSLNTITENKHMKGKKANFIFFVLLWALSPHPPPKKSFVLVIVQKLSNKIFKSVVMASTDSMWQTYVLILNEIIGNLKERSWFNLLLKVFYS